MLTRLNTLKGLVMYYIQRKDGRDLETVDEFTTYKEARLMCQEYQFSDNAARYYISQKPCKAWKEAGQ